MPLVGPEDETPRNIPSADEAKNPRSAASTFHDRQTAVSVLDQQLRVPREECPKIGVEHTHRGSKQPENVERRDDPAETIPFVHDGESLEVTPDLPSAPTHPMLSSPGRIVGTQQPARPFNGGWLAQNDEDVLGLDDGSAARNDHVVLSPDQDDQRPIG
jgi:hypothetical protein